MLTREENTTEFSNNLNRTYHWFDSCFTAKLAKSFSEFWNCDVDVKLVSISENNNFLTQREEFFVTKIRLNKELSVFVRLSKELVQNILEESLGANGKKFIIEKITDLEAKILTGFDDFLYKSFNEYIKTLEQLPQNNTNYNECNLTFYLRSCGKMLGKIVVKIPVVAIDPEKVALGEDTFTIANFVSQTAEVKINVGHTRIRLNDLKNIELDDIVLLENSNSSIMRLIHNDYTQEFRVVPNPMIMIESDFEDNEVNSKGDNMPNSDIYNMWDSIQVDIGAEFEKVKISLGELKQISEGLVVDIGSVYDNKIDLKVENKIVASGELVIINDRYGVRINQVHTEESEVSEPAQDVYEEPQNEEQFVEEEQFEDEEFNYVEQSDSQEVNEEEDFDYSDFDVDDDDL